MDSFILPFKFMVTKKYVFKDCIFKTNLISCSLLLLTGKGCLLCRNCVCILLCMLWACLEVMALSTTFHSHTLADEQMLVNTLNTVALTYHLLNE